MVSIPILQELFDLFYSVLLFLLLILYNHKLIVQYFIKSFPLNVCLSVQKELVFNVHRQQFSCLRIQGTSGQLKPRRPPPQHTQSLFDYTCPWLQTLDHVILLSVLYRYNNCPRSVWPYQLRGLCFFQFIIHYSWTCKESSLLYSFLNLLYIKN